eukprot:PhF_6_TR9696/c0_g1_i1/m.14920
MQRDRPVGPNLSLNIKPASTAKEAVVKKREVQQDTPAGSSGIDLSQTAWPSNIPMPLLFTGFGPTPSAFYNPGNPFEQSPVVTPAPTPATEKQPATFRGLVEYEPMIQMFPPPPPPHTATAVGCDQDTVTLKLLRWYQHVESAWKERYQDCSTSVHVPPPPPPPPGSSRGVVYSLEFWQYSCDRWWNWVRTQYFPAPPDVLFDESATKNVVIARMW